MQRPIDVEKANYTAEQIETASGLSKVLVQQYSQRGILMHKSITVGRRTYRRYAYLELLAAAALGTLRDFGTMPSEVMEDVRAAVGHWLWEVKALGRAEFVIVAGGRGPVFTAGTQQLRQEMEFARKEGWGWLGHKATRAPLTRPPVPCAFMVIDLVTLEQGVLARLGERDN